DPNYFSAAPVTDPGGAADGVHRVSRGGSWLDPAAACRSAFRDKALPLDRSNTQGFRVACDVTTPAAAPELDRFTHDRVPKGMRMVGLPREVVAVLGGDANPPIFGKPRPKEVRALAFNREGPLLVSGGEDEVIHVWNLASARNAI